MKTFQNTQAPGIFGHTPYRVGILLLAFSAACRESIDPDREPDAYAVTFVCESCGEMRATDMNEAGVVAGSELVAGVWQGRLWMRDGVIELDDFVPVFINDDLHAAGSDATGGAVWTESDGVRRLRAAPTGIDALGRVAIGSPYWGVWVDGVHTPIAEWSSFQGNVWELGRMNRAGDIAGSSMTAPYSQPLLFREGSVTSLHIGDGRYGTATAVNDNRDVIGTGEIAPLQGATAYFVAGGVQQRLAFAPRDLNNAGQVVGDSADVAVLWQKGHAVPLTATIHSTGYIVTKAIAITDGGEILAQFADGRYVRLRPLSPP